MRNTATVTNASIDSAGLPKDYKNAIAEYIWNGFDAGASQIDLNFKANELGFLTVINIVDNGSGILHDTLSQSFGNFLDSQKRKSLKRSSYMRGKKGKGRFSFSLFASKATWLTVYKDGNQLWEYKIVIDYDKKEEYEDLDKQVSNQKHTGTTVKLEGIFGLTADALSSVEFYDFLAQEFGWFLLLNKEADYALTINGKAIQYEQLILENESITWIIADHNDNSYRFKVDFIRWGERIGDKYYYYFLNPDKTEVSKQLTSFNNNAIDFHHSVFIESSFFDLLEKEALDESEEDNLFSHTGTFVIYKKLRAELKDFLAKKEKKYLRELAADKHLLQTQEKQLLPLISEDFGDKVDQQDLLDVLRELYCVEPKIFNGLRPSQQKTFLGMLQLLLRSDKRRAIQSMIEQIVTLSEFEKQKLTAVLEKN
ncbi:ATP-binding protein [Sphingobacterium sp. SRCM116780]|uniref:ATP-binding protein n=1 Tax=Sphingobacterium sp. SRCM116780 TaxID=2907623 RepID=UPI001F3C3B3C|nr:ATP-binding protein [Sphingobacterium sp. SRCM116780]UIR56963.1 ATP-binding protein [Sphingobacterium sp. SRCM116780]